MKTTNYYNTFIEVAEDCPADKAEIPPRKGEVKTVAVLQFESLVNNPYKITSDELLFRIYALKKGVREEDLEKEKEAFFSKGQACMRASPLPKRYGWGVHSNGDGKIALYRKDSEEYKKLSQDPDLKHLKAMRSSRG